MILNLLKNESFKKGLIFSTGFNILAKILVFFQSILVAYYFGSQDKTDIYFFCFATITLISSFINTLDSSVIIPESMRISQEKGVVESMKFLNFFIFLYLILIFFISLVLFIDPINSFLAFSKFDRAVLNKNSSILSLSIPLIFLITICSFLSNILTSYRYFTIPMIIGIVNAVFCLLSILFLHKILSVLSIISGLIVSYLINLFFLIYLMKKNLNWRFKFSMITLDKRLLSNIFFSLAGNVSSSLTAYVPLYLFSGYYTGIITNLNYGQKTAEMPNQLVTVQFSSVVGIKFNDLYASGNIEKINEIFLSTSKLLIFSLSSISGILFLYSDQVITILYKRGAFDTEAVIFTSEFLKLFSLLLPFYAMNTLISRLFMASQKIRESFFYQTFFNIILILIIFIGVRVGGIKGYPYSLLFIHCTNVLLFYFFSKKYFAFIKYKELLINFTAIFLLNFTLIFSLKYIKPYIITGTNLIDLGVGSFLYFTLLIIVNILFNINLSINEMVLKILRALRTK